MEVLRTRIAALIAAFAVATAFAACGDDDGKGAAEEIEKGAEKLEKGARKGAKKIEKEGRELEDDVRGRDERNQR